MKPLVKQIFSAFSITLVGYTGGVVLAYPGVLLAQLSSQDSHVKLSTFEASCFASIAQLVAIPGSIIGGLLMEKLGPRKLILFNLPILGMSWIGITHVTYYPTLLICVRAFQGIINSFLATTAYIYACEIADVKRRGALSALVDSMFSLGFLVTYLIGGAVRWNYFSYVTVCITVIPCFILIYFIPESPVWLIRHGKFAKARIELKRIRKTQEIEDEILSYEGKCEEIVKISTLQRFKLLGKAKNLFAVLSAATLLVMKEATGQFAVVLFVFQIFRKADPSISIYWSSAIVGVTRFISTLLACVLLSKIPRKILIVLPSYISAVALGVLGTYFYLDSWNKSQELMFLPLALLTLYVVCYGIGTGPISWVLATEIQPSSVRSIGSGIGQASFNLTQWLIAGSFAEIEGRFGLHTCFWIYCGGCVAVATFVLLCLPETKGKSLPEVEHYWEKIDQNWTVFKRLLC